jgi:hypothetical protein
MFFLPNDVTSFLIVYCNCERVHHGKLLYIARSRISSQHLRPAENKAETENGYQECQGETSISIVIL